MSSPWCWVIASCAAHWTRTHASSQSESKLVITFLLLLLCGRSQWGIGNFVFFDFCPQSVSVCQLIEVYFIWISRLLSNTLKTSSEYAMRLPLAACALPWRCSSCSVARCHVSPHSSGSGASAGEALCSCQTFACAPTHTHARRPVESCTGARARPLHALAEITCFTRTLERGRRDVWQALTFLFQLQKTQLP